MHLKNLSLLALTSVSAAQSWPGVENLPDGPYSGIVHANWSTTITHLESGTDYFFTYHEEPIRKLQKRKSYCSGYQLNHGGVDGGFDSLKRWAGGGQQLISRDTTRYYGFNNQGVYVYACVNAPHEQYSFSSADISLAFANMDGKYGPACKAYEASYYVWPNTDRIVGKARSGSAVCLG